MYYCLWKEGIVFLLLVILVQCNPNVKENLVIELIEQRHSRNQISEALHNHHRDFLSSTDVRKKHAKDYHVELKSLSKTSWVSELCIGTASELSHAQCFMMILDTGSTNLWIPTTECTQEVCLSHPLFNPAQSSSFSLQNSENGDQLGFHVVFGTGEISGVLAQDRMQFGGKKSTIELTKQSFGAVSNESGNVFRNHRFSGVIGLGFPTMAAFGHQPLFDSIMQTKLLARNAFVFRFPKHQPGFLMGTPCPTHFKHSLQWLQVNKPYYWSTDLIDVRVAGKSLGLCSGGCQVIFDSGTTLNTAPSDSLRVLLRSLNYDPAKVCHFSKMPTLTYVFNNGIHITLQPGEYAEQDPSSQSQCRVQFMAMDVPEPHGPAWILGTVFLKAYYTLFDRDKEAIGIARHNYEPLDSMTGSSQVDDGSDITSREQQLLRFNYRI